jgi:spore germination protein (amino acid permease)
MIVKNTISSKQLAMIIIQSQFGIGLLSLPYVTFLEAKKDAWVSTLLMGVLTQCAVIVIYLLCKRFPMYNLFEFLDIILGKAIGKIFTVFYILYFILAACTIIIYYGYIIKMWILPNTPLWLINLLMIGIGIYLAKENLHILARFYMLVSVLLIIIVLLVTFCLKDANIFYILPIGDVNWQPIFKGVTKAFLPYCGFEVLLIIFPYVQGTNSQKLKVSIIATSIVTILYTYIVLVTLLYFSPQKMYTIPEPLLYLVKTFSFHIFARADLMFLSIWITCVLTSFVIHMYVASIGLKTMLKKTKRKYIIFLLGFLIFTCTGFSYNLSFINWINSYLTYIAFILIFIFPLVLLISSRILKRETMQ